MVEQIFGRLLENRTNVWYNANEIYVKESDTAGRMGTAVEPLIGRSEFFGIGGRVIHRAKACDIV